MRKLKSEIPLSKIEKEHCKALGITEDQLRKSQQEYLKAEKEGRIVPMKIDDSGYPYVELETNEKN